LAGSRERTPGGGDAGSRLAELNDRELVELCLGRGPETEAAWEELVRRYQRKVFALAYKFTGRYEEAEDLKQEIFFRVFRALDRFHREADFATWLFSVGRNHCIDHYRSGRREKEALTDQEVRFEEMASSGGLDPYRSLEARDRKQLLRRALAAVPAKLREAVVLRDIHGLSYQEIVARLRLPEGTVKSRINRGRLELGRALVALGGAEETAASPPAQVP
jgi:RNA polymerase sigma-70 factor (ECF subfamily)